LFVGGVLLLALGVTESFRAFSQLGEAAAARALSFNTLDRANDLLSKLRDAETGERGYALTGDEAFLEPYLAVRGVVAGDLEGLRRNSSTSTARKDLVAAGPLIDAKMAEMARIIGLRGKQDIAAVIAAERGGQGKRLMDSIQSELGSFITVEHDALLRNDARFEADMRQFFLIIAGASVLILLFAFLFAYFFYRETRHRLTTRVHVETQQLLELQRQTNKQLQQANLAKSDFLSSMSHELRSPLNAILGFAQLMESETPPPTPFQSGRITQILNAGWHLLALINEILDLAVIESGQVTLSREAVSLVDVMSECRAMMEPQAQSRGIVMSFPRFENPVFVKADVTRLKQIIINLLSNAIKYNREHGTITVECAVSAPQRIRITVRDTGVGLDPEQLSHLFQPFNRLGQETGDVDGTGIGLVVTKRLTEMMDGVLGVESTPGVGSAFWCELSAAAAPRIAVESGDAQEDAFVRPELPLGAPSRTLLYIEDNPANMELVKQLVSRCEDIRMMTAVNATLGIELARSTLPTVILMDINLPGINGVRALKILRENPATERIPVVALSANAMPRDIAKGLEAGFFSYLTKPIRVKEFMDALNAALAFAEAAPVVRK
jgi:signal transduction histidine kinase/CheY-like chemotaxis protein